jgi:hypothetical protein
MWLPSLDGGGRHLVFWCLAAGCAKGIEEPQRARAGEKCHPMYIRPNGCMHVSRLPLGAGQGSARLNCGPGHQVIPGPVYMWRERAAICMFAWSYAGMRAGC